MVHTVEVDDEFCRAASATGGATGHGMHLPGRLVIKLRGSSTCSPDHVRMTLFNETLHAIEYVYCGGPGAKISERVIEQSAPVSIRLARPLCRMNDSCLKRQESMRETSVDIDDSMAVVHSQRVSHYDHFLSASCS